MVGNGIPTGPRRAQVVSIPTAPRVDSQYQTLYHRATGPREAQVRVLVLLLYTVSSNTQTQSADSTESTVRQQATGRPGTAREALAEVS